MSTINPKSVISHLYPPLTYPYPLLHVVAYTSVPCSLSRCPFPDFPLPLKIFLFLILFTASPPIDPVSLGTDHH